MTRLSDPTETMLGAPDVTRLAPPSRVATPLQPAGAVRFGDAPFPEGTLLGGRYRIVRMIGQGGMGVVYQADDLRLGHPVALKFLPPALAGDARRLEQFHNEVSVARQVSHPNVCRVYDIGDVDGHLFLSMEYIDGEDLATRLRHRGPLPEADAVELTRQICGGLAAVHARGVLHRDLKPANIMINKSGQAQLMDFGIAAGGRIDDRARMTEGTPAYMAPEQLAGENVTVQSDIYALGLVMYEVFTGARLFDAKTLDDLRSQQVSLTSSTPAALTAAARPGLHRSILQCLEQDPSRRPASAQAVAGMLQTLILDAHTTWRRILQGVTPMAMVPLTIIAFKLLRSPSVTNLTIALVLVLAIAALIVVELRFPLGWTVPYKGHQIRFYNNMVLGERLFIDGVLVDRGRVGINITLRGTIERGAGAGERITAQSQAKFPKFSCRIVAESFAP